MRVKTISVLTADTVALGLTATGDLTQGDALVMPADLCEVTAQDVSSHSGVVIPSDASVGDIFTVINQSGSALQVYPPSGGIYLPNDSISTAPVVDQQAALPNRKIMKIECVDAGVFSAYFTS